MTILGSTGSIGTQTLDILERHSGRFSVFALSANRNVEKLFDQCLQCQPQYAVMVDDKAAFALSQKIKSTHLKTEVLSGEEALMQIVADAKTDLVMAAIVGAAGLMSTMAAVRAGKRVLLANKESLVMAGDLLVSELHAHNGLLLPVDSEHNAIFQCLPSDYHPCSGRPCGVDSIILTASGGPFRTMPVEALKNVTPEQAVAHPNWSMGRKISVDSATMMNKGLEVIEAHWLYGLPAEQIEVVIHPQSIVHAMVRMRDGSVLAHMAKHDMRVPIAHVLAWPKRITSGVGSLDFASLGRLDFEEPSFDRYPCLGLAYEALRAGGTAMALLNAANEVAVSAFLKGELSFHQIPHIISEVLNRVPVTAAKTLDEILEADRIARIESENIRAMDPA